MHQLAIGALAALTLGCLGEKTKRCNNGATCPHDEVCTEVPITEGATLCGTPRLVEACAAVDDFTACDFTTPGSQDGACVSKVCVECQSIDLSGCRAPGWNAMTSPTGVQLADLWVASASEAYAVGEMRTLLHYDGATWSASTLDVPELDAGAALEGVWGTTPADVFVVSGGGEVVQLDGTTWRTVHTTAQALQAIAGAGTTVIAVGGAGTIASNTGGWSTQVVSPPAPLFGVWVGDANNAIAVGSQGMIFRFKDGAWTVDRAQQTNEPPLRGVWGRSPDDLFAVGDRLPPANAPNILRYENGTWTRITTNLPFGTSFTQVWGTADGHVFASGSSGALAHFDGAQWKLTTIAGDQHILHAVEGSGRDNVFVAGTGGQIFRYTGID
jgi:hypothetical protein